MQEETVTVEKDILGDTIIKPLYLEHTAFTQLQKTILDKLSDLPGIVMLN